MNITESIIDAVISVEIIIMSGGSLIKISVLGTGDVGNSSDDLGILHFWFTRPVF